MSRPSAGSTQAAAVKAAEKLLSSEGPAAVTMRRIAAELHIQAPSLYKHFPGKRALEAAVIAQGLREFGAAMAAALAGGAEPVRALANAYRAFGRERPHLYRLMNNNPLPRDLLPPGLEDDVSRPLVGVFGDRARARVAWATAHGLVSLELAGRFPAGADVNGAWDSAVRTLRATAPAAGTRPSGPPRRGRGAARPGTRQGLLRRRRT